MQTHDCFLITAIIIDFVVFIARGCYAYLLSIEDFMDMGTWQI